MDAEITIKAVFKNVCSKQDLIDTEMTFREMVELLVDAEGILGVVEELIIVGMKEIEGEA